MNRFSRLFDRRRAEGLPALIFYVTAGDPSLDMAAPLLHALVAGGGDVIELGYPFGDPILDGPVIRQANRRALDAGASLDTTLGIVRKFREGDQATPIVLMGYGNPVLSRDAAIFARMAQAGVDGLIVPDLPLREAAALLPTICEAGLVLVPLVPPADMVDAELLGLPGIGGFTYCVAQAGPTGGAVPQADAVRHSAARCRELAPFPVAVGFGIKTPQIAAGLAAHADAVIVGSALVDHIRALVEGGAATESLLSAATRYCADFRTAIDAAGDAPCGAPVDGQA